ncbi:MAG: neutral/alkaline non-lysosomal ceramidase N-terminal domain-containing protein [Planctomycetota bacterium]|nr:neutral/alkaline non-lysosomal ceramidase N-terminal domain-containing protein [Planctomycetota bacterium]
MRKNIKFESMTSMLVVLLIFHISCPAAQAVLKGGCAKVNITPPLGIPLIGSYGKPSDEILDELYAKSLVFDDGANTVVIVSADLLYTPLEEITDPVRKIITEKVGIAGQNVLVCGTHTHSGPEVFSKSKLRSDKTIDVSTIDRSYLETLINKIAGSVLLAHKNMQPVKIGAAKGKLPEIVFNRRPTDKNGLAKMTFSLPPGVGATRKIVADSDGSTRVTFDIPDGQAKLHFGPIDPEVSVLRVEDTEGKIVGSLVNFGCHPVSIYPSRSTAISADYPGHTTRVVEQAEGGLCLFTLGLAGNAVPFERGVEPCRQIGTALGGEALRRLQFVSTTDNVTLKAVKRKIVFPTKKASSPDAAGETMTTEIQALKLGDIYVLGLPGEILIEVGLEIKNRAGLENLFIVTICNDSIGYVCHSRAYDEGGYEPVSGTNLAKGAGELMIKHALDLINRIKHSR